MTSALQQYPRVVRSRLERLLRAGDVAISFKDVLGGSLVAAALLLRPLRINQMLAGSLQRSDVVRDAVASKDGDFAGEPGSAVLATCRGQPAPARGLP